MNLLLLILSAVSIIIADDGIPLDREACLLYCLRGKLYGCTGSAVDDHCNVELKDYPEYLKSIPSCSVIFDPCRTVLEDTERCHITASTSTDTPNSTPNDSEGTPSTRTPTHTSLTTPILTPVSTVTSNAPIGGQTDSLTATPTASPAPSSDGPGLSPGVIATIVVSTVTVIGAPLWLIRCYRHRRPRATSSVEENASPKPAEKRNESVVMGYTELLGSTQMRHEMLSHTPPNASLTLCINTIAEIDSNPLRKTPEVSPEDVSPEDAISQAMSFSTTTAISRPEPPQATDEEAQGETNIEAPEDSSGATSDTESELDMLWKRQKELERKRHYLQQIQEIDEEEARLQGRIDELQRQSQSHEK